MGDRWFFLRNCVIVVGVCELSEGVLMSGKQWNILHSFCIRD